MTISSEGVMTCPKCDSERLCGHVDRSTDRIQEWSCEDCGAVWPRGRRDLVRGGGGAT